MRVPERNLIICPCILCLAFLLIAQVKAERQDEFRKDSSESNVPAAQRPGMVKKDGTLKTSPPHLLIIVLQALAQAVL